MLEALVFHPFWCLGAQRKGMVIAMNFPTALLAAAVAAVFISIVVSGVRRRKRGGGCSGGCGCSGCAGPCHLEK